MIAMAVLWESMVDDLLDNVGLGTLHIHTTCLVFPGGSVYFLVHNGKGWQSAFVVATTLAILYYNVHTTHAFPQEAA